MKLSTIATSAMWCLAAGASTKRTSTSPLQLDLSKDLEASPSINRSPGALEILHTSRASPYIRTVMVIEGGKIVASHVRKDVDPNELFFVHSVTKSVTSLLVGVLVDGGAIESVDETLGQIFADETTWEGVEDADYRKVRRLDCEM
jgi:CubicO group peptidase (beta-lactamase class C family)